MKLFWETKIFHHNDRQYPFKENGNLVKEITNSR
jgi:hypothetical protein